ncbi:recombinase family protein [Streptomyces niveus]|uniref:recombinase family protein n=1 Tax=Streptomyces niveus TaxID=193462 RepID=UPI0036D9B5C9
MVLAEQDRQPRGIGTRVRQSENLWKVLGFLHEGDTLIVPSLDQLGRSVQNLIAFVPGLRKRGQAVDMTTPSQPSRSSPANSPCSTNEGLDAVRTRGARLGRPPATTSEQASRPRPAHPPREHRDLDREAPRRLPQRHLQLRARN